MPQLRPAILAATVALAATPVAADVGSFFDEAERFLRRVGTQYAILMLRGVVDVTYDSLSVDPRSNDVMISGMRLYPELAWDPEAACEIAIDRIRAGDLNDAIRFRSILQVSGVRVPASCFQPQQAAMLASFGFVGVEVDAMTVDVAYELPTSATQITVQAGVPGAGGLSLDADFGYLFFRMQRIGPPPETTDEVEAVAGDLHPVAYLDEIEIVFENDDLLRRIEPLMVQQLGSMEALPQMLQGGLMEAFSEGGSRQPTQQEQTFAVEAAAELARFLEAGDRLVVRLQPDGMVLLDDQVLASPSNAFAVLDPKVAAVPSGRQALIDPTRLSAALSDAGSLAPEDRLKIGRALATGTGAPRSPAAALALLRPLAEAWNGEAALLAAQAAAEAGDRPAAYRFALHAMAGGEARAIGLADTLEADMTPDQVLEAQAAVIEAWRSDAGAAAGPPELTPSAMRALAADHAAGSGVPRSYAETYYWAALAAAAGDRVAEGMINRLQVGFGDASGKGNAWASVAAEAAGRALTAWTEGGVGATLAPGSAE